MGTKTTLRAVELPKIEPSITRDVGRTAALVADADGTLWHGRWVEKGLGYKYLANDLNWPWNAHNYPRAMRAVVGVVNIKLLLKKSKDKDTAEADGLRLFYDILVRNGLGQRNEMTDYARTYMTENMINPVFSVKVDFGDQKFSLIATQGGSTGAETARTRFGFNAVVSNQDIFDQSGRLRGIKIAMPDGEAKVRMVWDELNKRGISLRQSTAIGDGLADIPMLMEAKVKLASPDAKPEVLAIPGIIRLEEQPEMPLPELL